MDFWSSWSIIFLWRAQPFLKCSCEQSTYLLQPRFGVSLAPMTRSVSPPHYM